ncbi:MAG: hypothetical protein E7052_01055 [Lentisphaerae bacterium]|nr:hypothetical protein [Lentisphaerota bacterium]
MINKVVFLLLSELFLLLVQLMLGSLGWPLPLALMGVFYFTLAYGRSWGIAGAMIVGMVLAVLYGGSWNLLHIAVDPLLVCYLDWWISRHDESVTADFWQPGAVAAVAGALPALAAMIELWQSSGSLPGSWYMLLLDLAWSATISSGIFMLILLLGEAFGEYLGLPRFLNRKVRK